MADLLDYGAPEDNVPTAAALNQRIEPHGSLYYPLPTPRPADVKEQTKNKPTDSILESQLTPPTSAQGAFCCCCGIRRPHLPSGEARAMRENYGLTCSFC